jgi:hypothetical protein
LLKCYIEQSKNSAKNTYFNIISLNQDVFHRKVEFTKNDKIVLKKYIRECILAKFKKYNSDIVNCIERAYLMGEDDEKKNNKALEKIKLINKVTFYNGSNVIKYIKASLELIEKNILVESYNKKLALSCLNANLNKFIKENF